MKNGDRKLEMEMMPEALPGFLRELAAAFEAELNRCAVSAEGELQNQVQGYKKLSLGIKRKGGQVRVKLKVKKPGLPAPLDTAAHNDTAAPAEAEAEAEAAALEEAEAAASALDDQPAAGNRVGERPDYKILKKRMKNTFKEIRSSLEHGLLPEEAVVRQFCNDSALMVTYPGKGDPHYPRLTQVVMELKTAYKRKDFAVFTTLVSTLAELKNDCHREYK